MAWQTAFTTKAYAAKTIATGVLTLNSAGICYYVDGEGSLADNLVTISGAVEGQMIVIKANGVVLTIKHGTGNIQLAGAADFTLAAEEQFLMLYDGTNWRDIQTSGVGDFIAKAAYVSTHSILIATVAATPAELVINQQEVLGRLTGGNIDGITIGIADDNILQVDGTLEDNDFLYATASGVEGKTAAETKALLGVGITDNALLEVDDASAGDNEFARFTANGIEGLTVAEAIAALLGAALPEDTVIQLDPVLANDEHWSGISILGHMGYAATVGDIMYFASDGHWEKTLADDHATSDGMLGMCLATTAEGSDCQVLVYGKIRSATLPALTIGAPVYLDDSTAGKVVTTIPAKATGHIVRIVGYGLTAEDMMFCPDPTYIEYA